MEKKIQIGSKGGSTGETGDDLLPEAQLQQELEGDDVLLKFKLHNKEEIFLEKVFKQGYTFEWVKNQVALILETKYNDLTLFLNGKRIPEPFCLVDMGVQSGSVISVQIAEGAVIGLDEVRKQIEKA